MHLTKFNTYKFKTAHILIYQEEILELRVILSLTVPCDGLGVETTNKLITSSKTPEFSLVTLGPRFLSNVFTF